MQGEVQRDGLRGGLGVGDERHAIEVGDLGAGVERAGGIAGGHGGAAVVQRALRGGGQGEGHVIEGDIGIGLGLAGVAAGLSDLVHEVGEVALRELHRLTGHAVVLNVVVLLVDLKRAVVILAAVVAGSPVAVPRHDIQRALARGGVKVAGIKGNAGAVVGGHSRQLSSGRRGAGLVDQRNAVIARGGGDGIVVGVADSRDGLRVLGLKGLAIDGDNRNHDIHGIGGIIVSGHSSGQSGLTEICAVCAKGSRARNCGGVHVGSRTTANSNGPDRIANNACRNSGNTRGAERSCSKRVQFNCSIISAAAAIDAGKRSRGDNISDRRESDCIGLAKIGESGRNRHVASSATKRHCVGCYTKCSSIVLRRSKSCTTASNGPSDINFAKGDSCSRSNGGVLELETIIYSFTIQFVGGNEGSGNGVFILILGNLNVNTCTIGGNGIVPKLNRTVNGVVTRGRGSLESEALATRSTTQRSGGSFRIFHLTRPHIARASRQRGRIRHFKSDILTCNTSISRRRRNADRRCANFRHISSNSNVLTDTVCGRLYSVYNLKIAGFSGRSRFQSGSIASCNNTPCRSRGFGNLTCNIVHSCGVGISIISYIVASAIIGNSSDCFFVIIDRNGTGCSTDCLLIFSCGAS